MSCYCLYHSPNASTVARTHPIRRREKVQTMSLRGAVAPLRAALRSQPVASSSGQTLITRSAQTDRYLAIRSFFTERPITPPAPISSPLRRQLRWNSSSQPHKPCPNCPEPHVGPPPSKGRKDHAQDYAPFIRRLIASSKVIKQGSPHRPSKEELLAAASGWWQRLRIRIKWFTIRGWRRFNMDDLSAFASWFVVGNSESPSLYTIPCRRDTDWQLCGS